MAKQGLRVLKDGDEVRTYRCIECCKLIDPKEKEFIIVEGNIYLRNETNNSGGGIVGNNFDASGKIARTTKFHLSCFKDFVTKLEEGI